MKLLFKKRKQVPQQANVIAGRFQAVYNQMQGAWATWMSRNTEHFSRKTWIALLVLFVLSIGACSIYIMAASFTDKKRQSYSITPIRKPKHITETGEMILDATRLPEVEYNRIKKFRLYMDSLARSPGGKMLYDSIIHRRPGLMDSVRFIENYYEQLKQ